MRSGECRAASDISAPGDSCRPRSDHPGVVSWFNSRSNARCTGGWWVHGSKDGPPSFRLLNGFDYRFGRCEVVAKTWHCHGAAKAASEIKTQEREAPPSRPLFISAADSAFQSRTFIMRVRMPYLRLSSRGESTCETRDPGSK